MAEFVLLVMTLAALLYAVFGGADFGAGIVDALLGRRVRERVDVAIAPVWEANHVWLVLVVVLAFVGFPSAYAHVSTLLHIPLAGMLLGIVARGAAFTFRHYDPRVQPARDDESALSAGYDLAFRLGSALTPLCIGFVLAALASGQLTRDPALGFYRVYVAPWNTAFGWSTGAFVVCLFAFEGAALLAAENPRASGPLPYLRVARRLHLATFVSAGLVALSAYAAHVPWLTSAWASPLAWGALITAFALTPAIAWAFEHAHVAALRLLSGAQLAGFVVGFFAAQFPVLVHIEGASVRFPDAAAPPAVLRSLCWAVGVGLVLIVPALGYLIAMYKRSGLPEHGG
jgi:cytochrome bd ubiquinol oxidase subunit II